MIIVLCEEKTMQYGGGATCKLTHSAPWQDVSELANLEESRRYYQTTDLHTLCFKS